jgi:hypothetical protein
MSLLRDLKRKREEPETQARQEQKDLAAQAKQEQVDQQAADQAKTWKAEAVKAYSGLVLTVLEELLKTVYPTSRSKTDYGEPFSFAVQEAPDDYQWALGYKKPTSAGDYFVALIVVSLVFNESGQPIGFECERFRESYVEFEGKVPQELRQPVRTGLSSQELIQALRDLHMPQKSKWQFWQR